MTSAASSSFSRRSVATAFFTGGDRFEDTSVLYSDTSQAAGVPDIPPLEVIAANRMAFGPRPGDLERIRAMGFEAYVEEQLHPNDADDALFLAKRQSARLRISYPAGDGYPAVDEMRPLTALDKPLSELWPLGDTSVSLPFAERNRPLEEVRVETVLRAMYSKWQLREVLVGFWHDHFNVDARSNPRIYATWPLYNRLFRRHALGNFRVMLEEVTKSIAMMYYLNLVSSRNTAPNKNFARELLELHTLGANNYFPNAADAPVFPSGQVSTGYTENDVNQVAAALTGWTIAAGQRVGSTTLPNTGQFVFVPQWNDPAARTVLNVPLPAATSADPMVQGRRILDILAANPSTARFICTKLCRRLVADNPPPELVKRAVVAWRENLTANDQIARVVRVILRSPEFAQIWGQKTKQPFEHTISFLRAIDANLADNGGGYVPYSLVAEAGHALFAWPAPNGFPDVSGYWLNTNTFRASWRNITVTLTNGYSGIQHNLRASLPSGVTTTRQIVDYFIARIMGRPVRPEVYTELIEYLRGTASPDAPPSGTTAEVTNRINLMVARLCVSPDFWWR
ncbi:MAG: DUF1800 domain-containing protein [Chloracidobacterium sp.]|nr:DUF1800 domain-containing protein [Chloracidobacterium sp.]MDW8218391.1 DUF1800 domain-containing protein [Acidobacteriota bacterium]